LSPAQAGIYELLLFQLHRAAKAQILLQPLRSPPARVECGRCPASVNPFRLSWLLPHHANVALSSRVPRCGSVGNSRMHAWRTRDGRASSACDKPRMKLFLELMVRTACCKDKSIDSTEASFTQQSKNGRTCRDRSERERATQTQAS